MRRVLFVGLLPLLLLGCPEGKSKAPSAQCEKMYEQCDLGGGKLGVCEVDATAACAEKPCLVCAPQH